MSSVSTCIFMLLLSSLPLSAPTALTELQVRPTEFASPTVDPASCSIAQICSADPFAVFVCFFRSVRFSAAVSQASFRTDSANCPPLYLPFNLMLLILFIVIVLLLLLLIPYLLRYGLYESGFNLVKFAYIHPFKLSSIQLRMPCNLNFVRTIHIYCASISLSTLSI